MFSQLYLNSCVQLWSLFAQVMPSGAPVASGAPAAAASPAATVAAPAATTAAPAATVTMPAAAASGAPVTTNVPIAPNMPQIDMNVPPVQHSVALDVAHGLVLFLYFVICVGLIVCVMFQTTKNEGLSGVIGGTATTSLFRGKKSAEETLSLWTTRLAVAFIVFSMLIWLMFGRAAG